MKRGGEVEPSCYVDIQQANSENDFHRLTLPQKDQVLSEKLQQKLKWTAIA